MSLKTSYTDANKYTSRKLQVRYRVQQIVTDSLTYYEVHRLATKSYGFLGMTETAADECAAAKVAQYTRTTYQWNYQPPSSEGASGSFQSVATTECMAQIQVVPDGPAWNVEIDVNEDDVVLTLEAPSNPATLFAAINSRSYDGGSGAEALTLTSTSRDVMKLSFTYSQNIPEFDAQALVCEYTTDASSTEWIIAQRSDVDDPSPVTIDGTETCYVRLRYGMIKSNVVEVSL